MKNWYQSKTIWINIIIGLTMCLAFVPDLLNGLGVSEHVAVKIITLIAFINNVLNIVLRMISNKLIGTDKE